MLKFHNFKISPQSLTKRHAELLCPKSIKTVLNPNLLKAEGSKWSRTLPNSNKAWYSETKQTVQIV